MIRLKRFYTDGSQDRYFLVSPINVQQFDNHCKVIDKNNKCHDVCESLEQIEDMILRDQFAMSAMNGLIASDYEGNMTNEELSIFSYKQADAMLKQRKEK